MVRLNILVLDNARKDISSIFPSRRKAGKRDVDKTVKITDAFACCIIHWLRPEIRVKKQEMKLFSLI